MSRLATSFVLGYHGCDRSVGERAIKGEAAILQSDRDHDWLGPGAYFWESDPLRALEWAEEKVRRKVYKTPYVVGAVIDLRNCLDLVSRENLELVADAYQSLKKMRRKSGEQMPRNEPIPGRRDPERKLRKLDCAVIRHLHEIIRTSLVDGRRSEPFDTVRGMFTEGRKLFPKSGFQRQTHVQISVVNTDCIRGLFRPLPYPILP